MKGGMSNGNKRDNKRKEIHLLDVKFVYNTSNVPHRSMKEMEQGIVTGIVRSCYCVDRSGRSRVTQVSMFMVARRLHKGGLFTSRPGCSISL
ncbi:hypothetical protein TNCV_4188901 [Trichonephila clavipes]|nr:hypothetical protein TNCV_4188901 [Trichonephila clavipes]